MMARPQTVEMPLAAPACPLCGTGNCEPVFHSSLPINTTRVVRSRAEAVARVYQDDLRHRGLLGSAPIATLLDLQESGAWECFSAGVGLMTC